MLSAVGAKEKCGTGRGLAALAFILSRLLPFFPPAADSGIVKRTDYGSWNTPWDQAGTGSLNCPVCCQLERKASSVAKMSCKGSAAYYCRVEAFPKMGSSGSTAKLKPQLSFADGSQGAPGMLLLRWGCLKGVLPKGAI